MLQSILGWSAGLLGLLFGLSLMREDRLWGMRATVQLLPVSGTSLFLSKLLLTAVVFWLLPLLVFIPFWLHAGMGASSLLVAIETHTWVGLSFMAFTLFLVHGQETPGGMLSRVVRFCGYGLILVACFVAHLWLRFHSWWGDFCYGSPTMDVGVSLHTVPCVVLLATWLTFAFRRPLLSVCVTGALLVVLGPLLQWRAHRLLEWQIEHAPAEVKAVTQDEPKPEFTNTKALLLGWVRIPFKLGHLSGNQAIRWRYVAPAHRPSSKWSLQYGLLPRSVETELPLPAALNTSDPQFHSYPDVLELLEQIHRTTSDWFYVRMSEAEYRDPRYQWHAVWDQDPKFIPPDQESEFAFPAVSADCLMVKEQVRIAASVTLLEGMTLDSQYGFGVRIEGVSLDVDGLRVRVCSTVASAFRNENPLFIWNEEKKLLIPLSHEGQIPFVLGHTRQYKVDCLLSAGTIGLDSMVAHPSERDAQLKGIKLAYIARDILGFKRLTLSFPAGTIHIPALTPEQMTVRAKALQRRAEWVQMWAERKRELSRRQASPTE